MLQLIHIQSLWRRFYLWQFQSKFSFFTPNQWILFLSMVAPRLIDFSKGREAFAKCLREAEQGLIRYVRSADLNKPSNVCDRTV